MNRITRLASIGFLLFGSLGQQFICPSYALYLPTNEETAKSSNSFKIFQIKKTMNNTFLCAFQRYRQPSWPTCNQQNKRLSRSLPSRYFKAKLGCIVFYRPML